MTLQGWECPKCHKVWSPTFRGPCTCASANKAWRCPACGSIAAHHYCPGPHPRAGTTWPQPVKQSTTA